MLHTFWNAVLIKPLYNSLVFIVSHIPWHDVGFAVIILTVIVKLILAPLNAKAIKSQIKLKALEPEIEKIKADYPKKEEQSRKTFDLYKKYKVNPFSGCLVLLIQFPIIIALYTVFLKGFYLNEELLYPFMKFPETVNTLFLGLVNIASPNFVLAILAGVSQYFQISLSQKNQKLKNVTPEVESQSFQSQIAKSMQVQMKYFLPLIIIFVAWKVSAAVALYWITSNIVGIVQEVLIARKVKKEAHSVAQLKQI